MKNRPQMTSKTGNIFLLIIVVFSIFVIPVFSMQLHRFLYQATYTLMFFVAVSAMKKHRKPILCLAIAVAVVEWISAEMQLLTLASFSRALNSLFFVIIAISLISQVARTKEVTVQVILEAINGYLLLGIIFAMTVAHIMSYQPTAFTFDLGSGQDVDYFSDYVYYAFVSFTTIGYGDVLPTKPYAKSFAILAGVTGQIYVAVIIAMLVGKFSTTANIES